MNNEFICCWFVGFVIGAFCTCLLMVIKNDAVTKTWHAEAIARGVAHWKVDQKTGATEFEWDGVRK